MFLLLCSFWPGSLFYMLTVLPVIWVAELKILEERIKGGRQQCELNAQNNTIEISGGGLVCTEVCCD